MNEQYAVHMTVPLLIRLLEFAREESRTDLDLHFVAENVVKFNAVQRVLDMADYKHIVTES